MPTQPTQAASLMKSDVKSRPQPIEEPPAPGPRPLAADGHGCGDRALWLVPLFSSLWLDELGTYWVVKDGLGDTVHRALTFHGQSPLYYSIVWAARSLGGNSEAVLRLPSLIATAASLVLLYRLARNLISREAARLTVIAFAATQHRRLRGVGGTTLRVGDPRGHRIHLRARAVAR